MLLETRDYAIARKQFDRQIGFFQAVKYPIVDMMCGIELSRSLAVGAAAALDHNPAGAETLALRRLMPPAFVGLAPWQPSYVASSGEWLAVGRLGVILPRAT